MKKALLCLSCILLLSASLEAQATSFSYEQLPSTDLGVALVSSAWDPLSNTPGAQVWDNFTLSSMTTITQIGWWGYNEYPQSGSPIFSLSLYQDANGAPGAAIYRPSGYVSIIGSSGGVYNYSFELANPFVAAAGTYWLSIFNELSTPLWEWQIAANPGDGAIQTDYASGSTKNVSDVAFQVVGSTNDVPVPEPSTLWLFGGALGLIGVLRRKLWT